MKFLKNILLQLFLVSTCAPQSEAALRDQINSPIVNRDSLDHIQAESAIAAMQHTRLTQNVFEFFSTNQLTNEHTLKLKQKILSGTLFANPNDSNSDKKDKRTINFFTHNVINEDYFKNYFTQPILPPHILEKPMEEIFEYMKTRDKDSIDLRFNNIQKLVFSINRTVLSLYISNTIHPNNIRVFNKVFNKKVLKKTFKNLSLAKQRQLIKSLIIFIANV